MSGSLNLKQSESRSVDQDRAAYLMTAITKPMIAMTTISNS